MTLPSLSSSWIIGEGGTVQEASAKRKAGRALTGRQRAEVRCSACGEVGHNVRNRKKCRGMR